MTIVPGPLASAAPADGVPPEYNFAADMLGRNLRSGRVHKAAYVDGRGSWSFGQLADRAALRPPLQAAGRKRADMSSTT
jgi:benzoate-CoA ligase